jgi:hypothetical protein
MNSQTMMYGYVDYSKYANSNGVTTFIHSKSQLLLLAADIFVLSTVLTENANHNACTKVVLLDVNDS